MEYSDLEQRIRQNNIDRKAHEKEGEAFIKDLTRQTAESTERTKKLTRRQPTDLNSIEALEQKISDDFQDAIGLEKGDDGVYR